MSSCICLGVVDAIGTKVILFQVTVVEGISCFRMFERYVIYCTYFLYWHVR